MTAEPLTTDAPDDGTPAHESDVLIIGAGGPSVLSWLLPLTVVAPGALGTAWALWLKVNRPRTYAGIATGGELD
ncbi:hypothetical protein ACL90Y_08320 [Micrococcus luteus]